MGKVELTTNMTVICKTCRCDLKVKFDWHEITMQYFLLVSPCPDCKDREIDCG